MHPVLSKETAILMALPRDQTPPLCSGVRSSKFRPKDNFFGLKPKLRTVISIAPQRQQQNNPIAGIIMVQFKRFAGSKIGVTIQGPPGPLEKKVQGPSKKIRGPGFFLILE